MYLKKNQDLRCIPPQQSKNPHYKIGFYWQALLGKHQTICNKVLIEMIIKCARKLYGFIQWDAYINTRVNLWHTKKDTFALNLRLFMETKSMLNELCGILL